MISATIWITTYSQPGILHSSICLKDHKETSTSFSVLKLEANYHVPSARSRAFSYWSCSGTLPYGTSSEVQHIWRRILGYMQVYEMKTDKGLRTSIFVQECQKCSGLVIYKVNIVKDIFHPRLMKKHTYGGAYGKGENYSYQHCSIVHLINLHIKTIEAVRRHRPRFRSSYDSTVHTCVHICGNSSFSSDQHNTFALSTSKASTTPPSQ